MKILTRTQIEENLREYYQAHYGENYVDVWYDSPAANVWVFRCENKIITLQCHILTGIVTEQRVEAPGGESL